MASLLLRTIVNSPANGGQECAKAKKPVCGLSAYRFLVVNPAQALPSLSHMYGSTSSKGMPSAAENSP